MGCEIRCSIPLVPGVSFERTLTLAHCLACFYDLREGCFRGVIDSATTGAWLGQQVTFLTVDAGAFET